MIQFRPRFWYPAREWALSSGSHGCLFRVPAGAKHAGCFAEKATGLRHGWGFSILHNGLLECPGPTPHHTIPLFHFLAYLFPSEVFEDTGIGFTFIRSQWPCSTPSRWTRQSPASLTTPSLTYHDAARTTQSQTSSTSSHSTPSRRSPCPHRCRCHHYAHQLPSTHASRRRAQRRPHVHQVHPHTPRTDA